MKCSAILTWIILVLSLAILSPGSVTHGGGVRSVEAARALEGSGHALDLGSGNAYVVFGNNPTLGFAQSTLKTWLKREGTGATATTGSEGLVARWGLNEGSGTRVYDGAATAVNDTLIGSGHSWVASAPVNPSINHAPDAPVLNFPANGATQVPASPTLNVAVSDPDSDSLTVTFFGRPMPGTLGPDFTIIVLPDTQYYTASKFGGSPAIFNAQTEWIVNNQAFRNIVFVTHVGDVTDHADWSESEWINASNAMNLLDVASVPYGVAVGNCDQLPYGDQNGTTTYYNKYFGIAHFSTRGYYGGHYGVNNDDHYELFSASGLDFVVVSFEYNASSDPAVLSWADTLLKTYSTRQAIVVNHDTVGTGDPGSFSAQGQAIYDALKNNPNLFLMLGGHTPGEGRRQDTFNGNTVYSLLADYQNRTNGGDGWLRILRFSPANNQIQVQTYSPTLDQYETDADSQFTLTFDMGGSSFQVTGTNTGVTSGSTTSMTWPNLNAQTLHEWYVTVNDGAETTTGPTWSFTTETPGTPPVVTMHPTGQAVNAGHLASFAAEASGYPTPTVQWQVSSDGINFSNIAGATWTTYTFTPVLTDTGKRYRAVFMNDFGTATTNAATLTVTQITLLPLILRDAQIGPPYDQTLAASGAQAPYNFSVTSGALPAGLTLSTGGAPFSRSLVQAAMTPSLLPYSNWLAASAMVSARTSGRETFSR